MQESALFLAEATDELNQGANFLSRLTLEEWKVLRRDGTAGQHGRGRQRVLAGRRA